MSATCGSLRRCESHEQLKHLAAKACDEIHSFHISRPAGVAAGAGVNSGASRQRWRNKRINPRWRPRDIRIALLVSTGICNLNDGPIADFAFASRRNHSTRRIGRTLLIVHHAIWSIAPQDGVGAIERAKGAHRPAGAMRIRNSRGRVVDPATEIGYPVTRRRKSGTFLVTFEIVDF
jgi:hypothetical protein